jgi:hypothetical protein
MLSESHIRLIDKELDRMHKLLDASTPDEDEWFIAIAGIERLQTALITGAPAKTAVDNLLDNLGNKEPQ